MKFINLTPHNINVVTNGQTFSFPSNGLARVSTKQVQIGDINGIPIFSTEYGQVEGLPDQEDGTIFIVSTLVRAQVPHRKDVFSPKGLVRDENGAVIGCEGLDSN